MRRRASEIVEIFTEDHDRLLVLFAAFERIRHGTSDDARQTLVDIACTEIVIHLQVEEEHLYAALADSMEDLFALEKAEVGHGVVRRLVAGMESMQAGDRLYDATFSVLADCLTAHIAHEQTNLFPLMEELDLPFDTLTQDIRMRRRDLRSEFGMPDAGLDDDDGGYRYHAARRPHYRHH